MQRFQTLLFSGAFLVGLIVMAASAQQGDGDQLGTTREIRVDEDYEGEEACLEGEQFLACGSECPEACYNVGMPRACGLRCKEGCFCSQGLVRHPDGHCVKPEDCPSDLFPDTK